MIVCCAGSGGHLGQLVEFADDMDEEVHWISDRTSQSESLLKDRNHSFVPHTAPRDILGVLSNTFRILRQLPEGATAAYSTGAGIAISTSLACLLRRIPFTYIESATRIHSLSLTGKVLQHFPWRMRRLVQSPGLVGKKWMYIGSLLDCFESSEESKRAAKDGESLRVFVTVGANQHIGFERMIASVLDALPEGAQAFWQYGPTDVSRHEISGASTLPYSEIVQWMTNSDVVVSHAGTGSILAALRCGRVPVVIPRSARLGEHVDEHQVELASALEKRGLAIVRTPDALTPEDILHAARLRARRREPCAVSLRNLARQ